MGFLDRQSRVVDVVLTERGRKLFAAGELDIAYYAFFDDGIDYDPWSSGSLSDEERERLIHSTPMLEAPIVPDRRTSVVPLEPTAQVFKAAPGYGTVPRLLSPAPEGSLVTLQCDQYSSGSTFIRSATNFVDVRLELSAEAAGSEGFTVHVYGSGTQGLTELLPRRDLRGRRSLDPFVAVSIDDESPQERASVDKPASIRKGGLP